MTIDKTKIEKALHQASKNYKPNFLTKEEMIEKATKLILREDDEFMTYNEAKESVEILIDSYNTYKFTFGGDPRDSKILAAIILNYGKILPGDLPPVAWTDFDFITSTIFGPNWIKDVYDE